MRPFQNTLQQVGYLFAFPWHNQMYYLRHMDYQNILAAIKRHVDLTMEEELFFTSILIPVKLKQGEFAERTGEVTHHFIHVHTGCLMTYYTDKEGNDQVIQFATSGWWTGDLHSLTGEVPSIYSTRALADSEVYLLSKVRMEELLQRFPRFERYFRIMFQNSLVTHQKRIIEAFSLPAEERYDNFGKRYPQLEQYVPLKYIASYLGITPEFLSKIRRRRVHG